jgi:aristolochene synthase
MSLDQLEYMSLEEGTAYNTSLMPLCRGHKTPDRTKPVEWIIYDLWKDMRTCDDRLAEELVEAVFIFMRAQTSKKRLQIKGLGSYLEYRQEDVGQAYVFNEIIIITN